MKAVRRPLAAALLVLAVLASGCVSLRFGRIGGDDEPVDDDVQAFAASGSDPRGRFFHHPELRAFTLERHDGDGNLLATGRVELGAGGAIRETLRRVHETARHCDAERNAYLHGGRWLEGRPLHPAGCANPRWSLVPAPLEDFMEAPLPSPVAEVRVERDDEDRIVALEASTREGVTTLHRFEYGERRVLDPPVPDARMPTRTILPVDPSPEALTWTVELTQDTPFANDLLLEVIHREAGDASWAPILSLPLVAEGARSRGFSTELHDADGDGRLDEGDRFTLRIPFEARHEWYGVRIVDTWAREVHQEVAFSVYERMRERVRTTGEAWPAWLPEEPGRLPLDEDAPEPEEPMGAPRLAPVRVNEVASGWVLHGLANGSSPSLSELRLRVGFESRGRTFAIEETPLAEGSTPLGFRLKIVDGDGDGAFEPDDAIGVDAPAWAIGAGLRPSLWTLDGASADGRAFPPADPPANVAMLKDALAAQRAALGDGSRAAWPAGVASHRSELHHATGGLQEAREFRAMKDGRWISSFAHTQPSLSYALVCDGAHAWTWKDAYAWTGMRRRVWGDGCAASAVAPAYTFEHDAAPVVAEARDAEGSTFLQRNDNAVALTRLDLAGRVVERHLVKPDYYLRHVNAYEGLATDVPPPSLETPRAPIDLRHALNGVYDETWKRQGIHVTQDTGLPLGSFEIRVFLPGAADAVAVFDPTTRNPQVRNGFTFHNGARDLSGLLGKGDVFTVEHPDHPRNGDLRVALWDKWADAAVAGS